MGKIQVVLFDMFNTLANNSTEFWSAEFDKLVNQYNISVNAEEFWNIWREGDKKFSHSRIIADSDFISYLDGWTNSFEYALTNSFWDDRSSATNFSGVSLEGINKGY